MKANTTLAGQRALVITPFLPAPLDAGHRKRVGAFLEMLKQLGCSITLLHFSAEVPHIWAEHEGYVEQAKMQVDELITYYPRNDIWALPRASDVHELDEWIDDDLVALVQRIFSRRNFDFVVINNVWMSKLFEALPNYVVRVTDTHDVFYHRKLSFERINKRPDFFSVSRESEALGWRRADINIAITSEERRLIQIDAPDAKNIHLPYVETMSPPRQRHYVSQHKVVFGFMGSRHPFNEIGLQDLVEHLRQYARWAPIELVIAGNIGRCLNADQKKLVVDLGYVNEVDEFYDRIDFCVSPLDFGSGLKIKVVEAISMGIPIISTRHSSYGTDLASELIVEDARALASRMAEIALQRPDLHRFASLIKLSQRSLEFRYRNQCASLANEIMARQNLVLIKLSGLQLPTSDPRFWIAMGLVRECSYQGKVAIFLESGRPEPSWMARLPPNIALTGAPGDGVVESRRRVNLDTVLASSIQLSVITDDKTFRFENRAYHCFDGRWEDDTPGQWDCVFTSPRATPQEDQAPEYLAIPTWSESFHWDPIVNKDEPPHRRDMPDLRAHASTQFVVGAPTGLSDHAFPAELQQLDVFDADSLRAAILLFSARGVKQAYYVAKTEDIYMRLFLDWCAFSHIALLDPIDKFSRTQPLASSDWPGLIATVRARGRHPT